MKSLRAWIQRLTSSPVGRFATVVVAALAAIVAVRGCQRPKIVVEMPTWIKPAAGERVRANTDFKPPRPRPESLPRTNPPAPVLPPIHFAVTNAPAPPASSLALPARRLIPCQLVNTVDSSSLDTPIIALVTRDVFWRGQLLVSKGTEVHGRAQASHLRDRIGSQGAWVLVWADGGEISINGLALDLDQKGDHWGPTDGSAGLKGTLEQAGNSEAVKLVAATFIAGLTQPFLQRQNTVLGSQVLPTVQNAALSGVGEVMESYAQRLLHAIEQESTFVRVPAGKAFYLYSLDPIRPPVTNSPSALSVQP